MKHLRIMRYVDEVARTGSIRKAADQLNVTASAVNRRIADLEDELGAQLFERRPRGVRLTAAGEVFVHYLRQQSGDIERMKSQIEDLKGLRRGTVRIACSQALAHEFLDSGGDPSQRELAKNQSLHRVRVFYTGSLNVELGGEVRPGSYEAEDRNSRRFFIMRNPTVQNAYLGEPL